VMRISSAWDPFQKLDWIWTHVPLEVQCNERICCGGRHHFVKSYVEEKSGRENKQRLKTYKLSRYFFLKGGAKGEESMQLTSLGRNNNICVL
jgi:hypothetical protein